MSRAEWSKEKRWLSLAVLVGLVLVAYLNTWAVPFQLDDRRTILENPGLADPHNWHAVLTTEKSRPLLDVSYFLNLRLGGPRPWGFHLVNLLLHLLNIGLFYRLLRRLLAEKLDRPPWLPWLATAFFAIHPLGTEAVTYISGRSALLCTTFVLLCTLAHRNAEGRTIPGGRMLWQLLGGVFYAAAVLTYPLAAAWPLALLAIDHFVGETAGAPAGRRGGRYWPYAALLLLYAAYRFFWIGFFLLPREGARGFAENLMTQAVAMVRGAALVLWPVGLNVDHDLPTVHRWSEGRFLISSMLLLAGAGFSLWRLRRRSLTGLALCLFAVAGLPLFLVALEDPLAERRLYLGLPWAVLALTAVLGRWRAPSPVFRRCAVGLLLILLCALTIQRNKVWQSDLALWSDAAAKSPAKWRPQYNLGNALVRAGQPAAALEAYRRAVEIDPQQIQSRGNLANLLVDLGRPREAVALLQPCLNTDTDRQMVKAGLANAYYRMGDYRQAETLYRQLLRDYPGEASLYYNLGNVLSASGCGDEAAEFFRRAKALGFEVAAGRAAPARLGGQGAGWVK